MTRKLQLFTESHGLGASYPDEKEAIRHATWLSFKLDERVFIREGLRTIGHVFASQDSEFQYDTQQEER